eukprot:GEMP01002138.1.p1 GENE.GEMP01002138.1~~GEMP01002138.1.p1  ORF type:complete len:1126 (+),score=264.59 GEMP01002138.1:203-3580(+)
MRSAPKTSGCSTDEDLPGLVALDDCVRSTSSFNKASDRQRPGNNVSETSTASGVLGASSFPKSTGTSCEVKLERRGTADADGRPQPISPSSAIDEATKKSAGITTGTYDRIWSTSSSNVPSDDAPNNTAPVMVSPYEILANVAIDTPSCLPSSSGEGAPICTRDTDEKNDWQSWTSMRDAYPDSNDENEGDDDDEDASDSSCDEDGPCNLPLTLFVDTDDLSGNDEEEEEEDEEEEKQEEADEDEDVDDLLSELSEKLEEISTPEQIPTESEPAPEPSESASERPEPESAQFTACAPPGDDEEEDLEIRSFIIHGAYEGLRAAFARRKDQWVEHADPSSLDFDFKWAYHTQVNWHLSKRYQFFNHIPQMHNLACKESLCRRAREMLDSKSMTPFFSVEHLSEWIPDCYDFSLHSEMFTQKYRMLHAMAILGQWLLSVNARRKKASAKKQWIESLFKKIGGVFGHAARKDWADRIDVEVIRAALGSCQRAVAGEKDCVSQHDWYLLSTHAIEKSNKQRRRSVTLANEELSNLEKDSIDTLLALSKDPQWHMNGYRNAWIVKPGTMARGKFIQVLRNFHGITRLCSSKVYVDDPKKPGGRKQSTSWVVQKYIENPLLLPMNGGFYKHDLRVWVLAKCDSVDFFAWIWNKPYVRVASSPWDQKVSEMRAGTENMWTSQIFRHDESARSMHLTNYSVSKQTEHFDAAQLIWQLDKYKKFLTDREGEDVWTNHLWPRITQIARQSLLWIRPYLGPCLRDKSFQLLGYDLLITDNLQVWLIEVNAAPDLSVSWPGKEVLLDNMWEEMLSLVIDKPPAKVTKHFDQLHPFPREAAARVRGLRAALVPQPTSPNNRRMHTSRTPTATLPAVATLPSVAALDLVPVARAEICPKDSPDRNSRTPGPSGDVPVTVPHQTSEASICSNSQPVPRPHSNNLSPSTNDWLNLHVIANAKLANWRNVRRKKVLNPTRALETASTSTPGQRLFLPNAAPNGPPTRGDRSWLSRAATSERVPDVTSRTLHIITTNASSPSSPSSPCSPSNQRQASAFRIHSSSPYRRSVGKMKTSPSKRGGEKSPTKEAMFPPMVSLTANHSSNLRSGARSSKSVPLPSTPIGSLASLGSPTNVRRMRLPG